MTQGWMIADTRRHSCNGGCRKKFRLNAEEGPPVFEAFFGFQAGERIGVAAQFTVGLETRHRHPDERVEPVQGVYRRGDPIQENVPVPDVFHLVQNDIAEHSSMETSTPILRQDEATSPGTENGGSRALRTEQNMDVPIHSKICSDFADEGEQPLVIASLKTGTGDESALAPGQSHQEGNNSQDPDREKKLREGGEAARSRFFIQGRG